MRFAALAIRDGEKLTEAQEDVMSIAEVFEVEYRAPYVHLTVYGPDDIEDMWSSLRGAS